MRKVLVLGLMFGTIAAWNAGCSGDDDDDDDGGNAIVSIAISGGTTVSVGAGSSLQLAATATFEDASTSDITPQAAWMTNSAGVATVGAATGVVTGIGPGVATITATMDDIVGSVNVTSENAVNATLTFTGSGWPHNTFNAWVRILEGGVVKGCAESPAIAGNAFSVTIPYLRVGHTYTYETFADLDGDNLHDADLAIDHQWAGSINVTTPSFSHDVPHGDVQSLLTWGANVGCPGS